MNDFKNFICNSFIEFIYDPNETPGEQILTESQP